MSPLGCTDRSRLRWPGVALLLLAVAGALPGCEAGEDRPASPEARAPSVRTTEGSFARIELRASHRWTPPRGELESRLSLFAVFVQHLGLEGEVARAHVGLSPEAPPLGPGECRTLGPVPKLASPEPEGEEVLVELLDAGALWVSLPHQSTLVRPTLYPDVLPHVSGVQYRATLSTLEEGLSLRQVSLQGFGGADVGTFEVLRREGPTDFRIQQVAGSAPSEAPFAVRATSPLSVRFAPADPDSDLRVRLRWQPRPGERSLGLECRPARKGAHLFMPRSLALVGAGPAGRDVTLEVLASRQETFQLPDGSPAKLLLTQSDSVLLTVMP